MPDFPLPEPVFREIQSKDTLLIGAAQLHIAGIGEDF